MGEKSATKREPKLGRRTLPMNVSSEIVAMASRTSSVSSDWALKIEARRTSRAAVPTAAKVSASYPFLALNNPEYIAGEPKFLPSFAQLAPPSNCNVATSATDFSTNVPSYSRRTKDRPQI